MIWLERAAESVDCDAIRRLLRRRALINRLAGEEVDAILTARAS
jgi:hypothetical protein